MKINGAEVDAKKTNSSASFLDTLTTKSNTSDRKISCMKRPDPVRDNKKIVYSKQSEEKKAILIFSVVVGFIVFFWIFVPIFFFVFAVA